MGEFSHYCSISRITIKPGNACVLIPLRDTTETTDNLNWCPATLPIFGTYTGYGSMGDIVQDDTTKLISNRLGVDIQLFTSNLMYDELTYPGIDGYMLIDRQVFDKLTVNLSDKECDHYIGKDYILTWLGFTFIDTIKEKDVRFNHRWELDGEMVYSDGRWLHAKSNINSKAYYTVSDLAKDFNLLNDWQLLDKNTKAQLWRLYLKDTDIIDRNLAYVLGQPDYFYNKKWNCDMQLDMNLTLDEQLALLPTELPQPGNNDMSDWSDDDMENWMHNRRIAIDREYINNQYAFSTHYLDNLDVYGDDIAKLDTLHNNMSAMSLTFEPNHYSLFTPQYGNYEVHSKILNIFKEVNDSYT